MTNIQKPPMPIIPEGENIQKYIVLKDFWLRDICLKKGQIITEPVSRRWIDLQLIAKYSGIVFKNNEAYEAAIKIANDTCNSCECQERKKRKYTRRKRQTDETSCECKCGDSNDSLVVFNVPEPTEVIVNEINKPNPVNLPVIL